MRHAVPIAVLAVLSFTAPAGATSIRYVPVHERVARADLVVVGTVTAVEDEIVVVERHPGSPKVNNKVAVVKVAEQLTGGGDKTHVRVGFIPKEDQPQDGLKIGTPVLEKGDEVVLFLRRHPGLGFYQLDGYFGAVRSAAGDESFKKAAAEAKAAAALLADPKASLRSKDADARAQTAWMLVIRYRAYPPGGLKGMKETPIDAAESRLILENLPRVAEKNAYEFGMLFGQLGLTAADGWEGSVAAEGGRERAAKWVKDHAAAYRIKKWVPDAAPKP